MRFLRATSSPMTKLSPERLKALRREQSRNLSDDIAEAIESKKVERAVARLPNHANDVMLRATVHRIIRAFDGAIPDDLEERYLAYRTEVAWMEDGVEVRGVPTAEGIAAVAGLAVAAREYHRRLAQLARVQP
jgi:hypothetical protein